MTGEGALERHYRRLLAWYPAEHRRAYGEEMIGVLMAAAPGGASRPGPAGAFDLIRGGLRARFRSGLRRLAETDWTDALAVCSVAVPVILVGYFTAGWLYSLGNGLLQGYTGPAHMQVERSLIVLAIAAPPLLALRCRRIAALIALALAGWLSVYTLGVQAAVAAGLLFTIPAPTGWQLLVLLAVPAYPGAVWAIGISGSFVDTSGFPNLVFLPTVLFACLAMAPIWRSRQRRLDEA